MLKSCRARKPLGCSAATLLPGACVRGCRSVCETVPWQAAKPAERGALAQQAEALVAVAAAHADGKEAYARGIATELLEDFLAVEERFAAAREATEQEVIDSLRQVRLCLRMCWRRLI